VEQIKGLVELARGTGTDLLTFGQQIRRLMGLPSETKITRKFLHEFMTMAQFDAAMGHYQDLLQAQVEAEINEDASSGTQETRPDITESMPPSDPSTERAATGTPDALEGHQDDPALDDTWLAPAEAVQRVEGYAKTHGLGEAWQKARHAKGLLTVGRLREIEVGLTEQVDAREKA
jgi:hypothetical protein